LKFLPFSPGSEDSLAYGTNPQILWKLKPVPWCETGFYYGKEIRPGKHPYHNAGVYYIQEPSAMVPAECLKAQPGDIILDLCAAPGGKSTQIAAAMKGEGILICNEIHPARAKILSENIERMGIKNALVLNETPEQLAEHFPVCFDKIMVDAPCSGEGMFRKNEEAGNEWSLDNVKLCADRQDGILHCAYEMLRPGGRMVYSTCTFAPEEDEGSVHRFLERHPDCQIAEGIDSEGFIHDKEGCIRLFPHKIEGEGHFAAVITAAWQVPVHGMVQNGSFLRCQDAVPAVIPSAPLKQEILPATDRAAHQI